MKMTEQEKILARLENAEKAIFALVSVLQDIQPPYIQEGMNVVMRDYYDANVSLGFEPKPYFRNLDS